jgi:tripartite-type tricarboxylate transporter receptor subunit TctC
MLESTKPKNGQGESAMWSRFTFATSFAILGLLTLRCGLADAQEAYPNRSVTLTIGFAAGGNGDIIARIVAEGLSPRLGQPVVVENRAGSGGNIASARVAKLPPDGYQLIAQTGGHAVSGAIYKSLPFDPVDDFQMISTVGYQSFMVAVRADSPIKTVTDLVAAAKAAPGKLTYSSVGVGSTQHLAGEWFSSLTGVQMTHVPYRSGSATMADLLGGQIDVAFDTITVVDPQFRAGKARVLGVTSGTRWWSVPDVAPVAEAVPGYDVRTWVGIAAPKGLPEPILKRLNDAMRSALADPAIVERLRKTGGMDVHPSSPEEMRTLVASQVARWRKVVADAKIPQQ